MSFATSEVENDVLNGGFHQYFWNTSGALAEEAVAGFRLIGANAHAALLERAIQMAQAEATWMRPFRELGTVAAFADSATQSALSALDSEFYRLSDDLCAFRIAYIRAHPDEFVTN